MQDGRSWFQDVTTERGLTFRHTPGPAPSTTNYFLPQVIGSGLAVLDYDRDGLLDIFLIQNAGPKSTATNALFRQTADGKFVDVTAAAGLAAAGHGMGAAVGDVNNDGWPDLLVTEYGGIRLYLNTGQGGFADATQRSGLDNPAWATSALFLDYDRDGWLDLAVANYVELDPSQVCVQEGGKPDFCHPRNFRGSVARLFHNKGKQENPLAVAFEDVTVPSGLGRLPGPGLGVACADFNGDRWPDIFVANDAAPNRLWINQRNGTFRDEALERGLAYNAMGQTQGNMGVTLGDTEGSGRFDVFVTHLTEETNTLWRQSRFGHFQDVTATTGITASPYRGTGFGTAFADFDNNGLLDLALVNGRVARGRNILPAGPCMPELDPSWEPYAEHNQIFASHGTGRFREISADNPDFCSARAVWRGLACADLDNDGGMDLVATTIAGPTKIFRNVSAKRGHWLLVKAVDPRLGGRDAYGAEIVLRLGRKTIQRLLSPGYSYLASNDPRVHFGLGDRLDYDEIGVTWPDGSVETFAGGTADRVVTLERGRSTVN